MTNNDFQVKHFKMVDDLGEKYIFKYPNQNNKINTADKLCDKLGMFPIKYNIFYQDFIILFSISPFLYFTFQFYL